MLYLRLFGESILFALQALRVNRLRSFLSLLGITIGIFAIISVFTVVDSLESQIRNSLKDLGDNVIYVAKWPWDFSSEYPWWKYFNRPLPAYKEMEEIQHRCVNAEATAFMIKPQNLTVEYGSNSVENVGAVCASFDFNRIYTLDLVEGRYFTENEAQRGKDCVIIGADIAAGLSPDKTIVGEEITIEGFKEMVIGVLKRKGQAIDNSSFDNAVIVPINSVRKAFNVRRERFQPMILVKGKEGISNVQLKDELKSIMRSIRKLKPKEDDNFALNEMKMISRQLDAVFGVISIAGWIIGGFSILVGGFGIANIMFVSVKERTSQIGIQKALGAKNYFILLQFLTEAVTLCLVGGIAGLLLIFIGTLIVNNLIEFQIWLSVSNIVTGMMISMVIGIVAGFMPAWFASRMNPVDAIRST